VICGNSAATFTVLAECAAAGVRQAVIASSQAISGRAFGPRDVPPAYLPIDETTPTHIADAYALSKATDEMTAAMMWRRHGLAVRALRFPFLGDVGGRLDRRAEELKADPAAGVRDLWAYLDVRDAARACLLAARIPPAGTEVILVAAPDTLCAIETEALLDTYLPNVPRKRRFAGHEAPLNLDRSHAMLGFEARYLWEWQG
jgi:nucleoside-diphosphate-sugar epimerase